LLEKLSNNMGIDEQELHKIIEAIKEAGKIIESYYLKRCEVTEKNDGSLVTQADIESNKYLCDFIKKKYVGTGLVTEELDKDWAEYSFTIDPLDGTNEFINEVPEFTVMVGLLHQEMPILGIIYNPITKELYYGGKDVPAKYVDKEGILKELKIDPRKAKQENILSISNKSTYELVKMANPNLNFEKYVKTGSEGLRLMRMAKQEANLRVERRSGIFGQWDVCAPQAILESAGGVVKSIDGSTLAYKQGLPFLQTGFLVADSMERLAQVVTQDCTV